MNTNKRVTIEIVWSLGGRKKAEETYCADNAAELENIRQYFIDEKQKIEKIPTATQTAYFETAHGSHPYGWDDAKNYLDEKPYVEY